jgi:hypothetical protein
MLNFHGNNPLCFCEFQNMMNNNYRLAIFVDCVPLYYFIWADHLHYRSSVTVTFHLNRATYDLSSAIHSCTDSHECLLYYSNEESRESVVIAVPDLVDAW